jgi:hypothetical protein
MRTIPTCSILKLVGNPVWIESRKQCYTGVLYPPKLGSWSFIISKESLRPISMAFSEVEKCFGQRRARIMCHSPYLPETQQPEKLLDEWSNALSKINASWFDESVSKRQRNSLTQPAKKEQDKEQTQEEEHNVGQCSDSLSKRQRRKLERKEKMDLERQQDRERIRIVDQEGYSWW